MSQINIERITKALGKLGKAAENAKEAMASAFAEAAEAFDRLPEEIKSGFLDKNE